MLHRSFATLSAAVFFAGNLAAATPRYVVVPIAESEFRFFDTSADAINAAGSIAGSGSHNDGDGGIAPTFAFLYGPRHSPTFFGPTGGPSDTFDTTSAAINAAGQVVGQSRLRSGAYTPRAFLYAQEVFTDLGTLDGNPRSASAANAINDAGQIVGRSQFAPGSSFHAFLYANGTMTDLGGYEATAINNLGQVVGYGAEGGFLYSAGITYPGAIPGTPTALNDAGLVVGYASFGKGKPAHAFLYNGRRMTDLGTLGGSGSRARGINNQGQIVGDSDVKTSRFRHGFLTVRGQMTDLNTILPNGSRWVIESANAINNAGLIAATGSLKGDFRHHALIIAPVPTLTILGPSPRVIHATRLTVRGRSDHSIARVTYSRRKDRNHLAKGTTRWHFTIALTPGRNVITVVARGLAGNITRRQLVVTKI